MASSAGPGSPSLQADAASWTRDFGSFEVPAGARQPLHWQRDEDVQECPYCETAFTTTVRRHHCRQCGRVVCDDCSRHRFRVPADPGAGKARVCNKCAKHLNECQANEFEEDIDVSAQIVAQLRGTLVLSYAESEVFKRVLLGLEADATGNKRLVDKYWEDPESDAYSFGILTDLAQQRWSELRAGLASRPQRRQALAEERLEVVDRRDTVAAMQRDLALHRKHLDTELGEVAKIEAERDELVRKEGRLQEALVAARVRIRELELERREHQERQERGDQRRWGVGRIIGGSSSSAASRPEGGLAAFTITAGRREDPLIGEAAGGGHPLCRRLEGCRRSCALM